MIPKTIHYCWFGGNPIPDLAKKCIKSWEKYCPDYQIIEWNESNYDISDTPLYVQQAYDAKKWAFVSDYVRLAVVYENGGIYLDTDVELIKRPTELLKYSAFFGFEDDVHVNTGLGFGAEKHAPILADMMEDYRNLSFTLPDGSFDQTPCPIRNTKALERIGLVCDNSRQLLPGKIAVFPKDYFCPLDYYTGVLKKTKNTVSIHRFAASWYSEKEKEAYIRKTAERQKEIRQERFRNGPKRFMRKLIGEERYNKAKEAFLLMWKGKKDSFFTPCMVIDMGKRIVRKVFCVVLILALLAGAELLWSNYTISVSDYEVRSEKISAPIRVVFLSDLHGKSFGKDNRRLTEKITAQEPDVIALVGDFFNSDADADEIDAMCSLIRQCVQIAPTYFSMGNHEAAYLKTDAADLRARIADAGAVIADNQYFDVSINGNDVRLGGYMGYYYQPHMMVKDPAQQRFERAFTKDFEDTDRYKLLFNHIPTSWLDWEYRNTHDVDLVLTGHYHGGIVRIPLIEQGLFAPYVGKFPPYTKGMYVGEKATCIITTGLAGSYGIPRFFNPPEICTVDILPAE